MDKLDNIRVRHSMLITAYMPIKHYIECIERNYLGEISQFEQETINEMKNTMIKVEETLWQYFEQERLLMGG